MPPVGQPCLARTKSLAVHRVVSRGLTGSAVGAYGRLRALSVRAGDLITVTIARVSAGRWQITVKGARSGSYATTRPYAGPWTSAEWIEEAPVVVGKGSPDGRSSGPILGGLGGLRPGAGRPVEVMCMTDTLVHPIAGEDNAIALIRFESGAVGQLEVSWTFRGDMEARACASGIPRERRYCRAC